VRCINGIHTKHFLGRGAGGGVKKMSRKKGQNGGGWECPLIQGCAERKKGVEVKTHTIDQWVGTGKDSLFGAQRGDLKAKGATHEGMGGSTFWF